MKKSSSKSHKANSASGENEGRNPVAHKINLFKAQKAHQSQKHIRLPKLLENLRILKTGKPTIFGGSFSVVFKASETQESHIIWLFLAMMVKMVKML